MSFLSSGYRVQNHNDGKHGNIILGKKEISKISKKVASLIEHYICFCDIYSH
jgi:hypothetical protein